MGAGNGLTAPTRRRGRGSAPPSPSRSPPCRSALVRPLVRTHAPGQAHPGGRLGGGPHPARGQSRRRWPSGARGPAGLHQPGVQWVWGARVQTRLSVRTPLYAACGLVVDRDENAAIKRQRAGQALRGRGTDNRWLRGRTEHPPGCSRGACQSQIVGIAIRVKGASMRRTSAQTVAPTLTPPRAVPPDVVALLSVARQRLEQALADLPSWGTSAFWSCLRAGARPLELGTLAALVAQAMRRDDSDAARALFTLILERIEGETQRWATRVVARTSTLAASGERAMGRDDLCQELALRLWRRLALASSEGWWLCFERARLRAAPCRDDLHDALPLLAAHAVLSPASVASRAPRVPRSARYIPCAIRAARRASRARTGRRLAC
jgi:hypothetical protein